MAKKKQAKTMVGTVVSNKMDKTVVVSVERMILHPVYHKYVKMRKKYKAHDENNECGVGDRVMVIQSRPISKEKRWRVKKIIEKMQTLEG
ncbi:MAG: 30S ribosomal protein S17 [bacterium]